MVYLCSTVVDTFDRPLIKLLIPYNCLFDYEWFLSICRWIESLKLSLCISMNPCWHVEIAIPYHSVKTFMIKIFKGNNKYNWCIQSWYNIYSKIVLGRFCQCFRFSTVSYIYRSMRLLTSTMGWAICNDDWRVLLLVESLGLLLF